jgi:hypothetical protein
VTCDYLSAHRYEIGPHVVAHALREGFRIADVLVAIRDGTIVEVYPDRDRCLIIARLRVADGRLSWLHIICDTANRALLGIVTAYRPDPVEWEDPPLRRRLTT